ncbi:MAG: repeat containing protein [Sphaerisporangium sp.]|nr:repeat containing protein [Sphaerisporangium sp.]
MMHSDVVVLAGREYRWSHELLEWPLSRGWAHHDIAVLDDGRIITSHPDGGLFVEYRPDGRLIRTTSLPVTETHGIHVKQDEGGNPLLWVADNGLKTLAWGDGLTDVSRPGRVVLLDLEGSLLLEIGCPHLATYEGGSWQPCAVVSHRPMLPNSPGTLWVADGYGKSLVHGFTDDGEYRITLDGTESGLRFNTPHALLIDSRHGQPELYVADRGNSRMVVYDLNGQFRRVVADPELARPSGLALSGDRLIVTDLTGGLAVFGADDQLLGSIGQHGDHDDGLWPNERDENGRLGPPQATRQARLNSPHGIAVDGAGRVLISEWLLGGRIICLTPM